MNKKAIWSRFSVHMAIYTLKSVPNKFEIYSQVGLGQIGLTPFACVHMTAKLIGIGSKSIYKYHVNSVYYTFLPPVSYKYVKFNYFTVI